MRKLLMVVAISASAGLALFGCSQDEAKAEIKGEVKTANVDPGAPSARPQPPDGKDDELEAIYGK